MGCLVGCISKFYCPPLRQTVNGENIAPWVRIKFSGGGAEITVGNESSPAFDNHAIIKTFECGMSDGFVVKAEIHDEQGSSFTAFIDRLHKCIKNASKDYKMEATFGWSTLNCYGAPDTITSPPVFSMPYHLEVNYSEGKIKYIITGVDLLQSVFVSREDMTSGSDDQKVPLKLSIADLFSRNEPSISVQFLRRTQSGEFVEWEFPPEFGKNGPKGTWNGDNQNKLATAIKWLEPFVTERGKGVHASWDNSTSTPTIIFWEDSTPDCDEGVVCGRNIGTFIVNGGKCSNVISFQPNISWGGGMAALSTGGGAGGPGTAKTTKKDKKCPIQTHQTGTQEAITMTRHAWDAHGPAHGIDKTDEGQNAHGKANQINTVGLQAIEAELVIQGDPGVHLVDMKRVIGSYVSIVAVNPFHIFSSGEDCGGWLAQPGCNEVLSNRNWLVRGSYHKISEGQFITTLNLFLATPGVTIDANEPLGGPGSEGYTPKGTC